VRPTLHVKPQLHETAPVLKDSAGESTSFYVRASRYRGLLHFVAHRVLGNSARADIAVQNCLYLASRDHKTFDSEGAFRGWLVRIAIDEALASLHGRRSEDSVVLIAK
jgi:DNA-directed RNA polymerase specialized sigma24 family protein